MTSFLKKYACLYENQEFTGEEQAEIGRFAANLMKLASSNDTEGIIRLFHEEFKGMDEETFDQVDRYFEFLNLYDNGSGMAKTAGRMPPIESVLSALAFGLATTPLIEKLIGKIAKDRGLKESLRKILQAHPELRKDPNVPEYFQAVADFSPTVAKNPLVAGNVMMQMHRVGPSYVTPQLIETLVGIQKEIRPQELGLGAMAEPMRELAGEVRTHKKFMAGGGEYGEEGGPDLYRKQKFFSQKPRTK